MAFWAESFEIRPGAEFPFGPLLRRSLQDLCKGNDKMLGTTRTIGFPNVRNWLGTTFIILGFAVLAINVSYLDVTVLTLAPDHGVELSDFIGAAALLAGVIALW